MSPLVVAHFINPFLPITQNWMYHQLRFNAACRQIVLCQTLENTDLFPGIATFPAFRKNHCFARASMVLTRARAQYFSGHYLKVIKREKANILHGHFSWESWRNFGLIKKTGLPLVTTFYGLDVNKLARLPRWRRRYKLLFQRGEVFTVEGPHMAAALGAIGCPENKIRVVPIGVDVEKISASVAQKDPFVIKIMFVGLEREKKGPLYAAKAYAFVAQKYKNIELHIVGNGPFSAPVRKLLAHSEVLDQCIFHGYVSFDEYCALLGRMDVVLAPSVTAPNGDTEGGAPVVVIEAQAAGTPVVATNHCDIPNVVVHNKTGLLCGERDVDALARNLELLVLDRGLREKFGSAARVHAREHFSIQRQVKDLNDIYRSLV
ncbi:MAG: glycosyltransferase [Chitinivibrionales bacterium]